MGVCTPRRIWLFLITLLKWHELASGLWLAKEPVSSLPDEVDHALAVCQGSHMVLNCRNRYNKIVVKNTFYGRRDNHTCGSKIFDTSHLCDADTPDNIKKKVDVMCTGEYKCKVPVTPDFLEKKGDHMCPNSRKYLQVTYACHQDPKLHMVCYNNCTSKCWPLCQKDCCEPPPPPTPAPVTHHEAAAASAEKNTAAEKNAAALQELTRVPQELTCRGMCPNRCAPQCDITCCQTKPQTRTSLQTSVKGPEVKSCVGDCLNLCAPLCRPSCCARHKKSAVKPQVHSDGELATIEQPPKAAPVNYAPPMTPAFATTCPAPCQGKCTPNCPQICCTPPPQSANSYFVEPLTSRMQCPGPCDQRCSPSCTPQCCMQYNRGFAAPPQAPGLSRTGYYGLQQPVAPAVANPYAPAYPPPLPPLPGYAQHQQAVARGGAQPPLVAGQTLEVDVPNLNYNKNNPQTAYQRVYPGGVPPGCPASCARSCDVKCKLGCCTSGAQPVSSPPMYFATQQVNDVDQRRTYEMLLQKYRNNQLQKYYQNTRTFAG